LRPFCLALFQNENRVSLCKPKIMETVFRIKTSELDSEFIKAVRALFSGEREIEITVSPTSGSTLMAEESREEYFSRLEKAAKEVGKGKVVRFSSEEFKALSNKLDN
jgi:hypothetical protein